MDEIMDACSAHDSEYNVNCRQIYKPEPTHYSAGVMRFDQN